MTGINAGLSATDPNNGRTILRPKGPPSEKTQKEKAGESLELAAIAVEEAGRKAEEQYEREMSQGGSKLVKQGLPEGENPDINIESDLLKTHGIEYILPKK